MSWHCQAKSAACIQSTAENHKLMTERPLWGSEWEQDKNCQKKRIINCTTAGRATQHTWVYSWTHTHAAQCHWLHREDSVCFTVDILNVYFPETARQMQQRWKCQSVPWLNNSSLIYHWNVVYSPKYYPVWRARNPFVFPSQSESLKLPPPSFSWIWSSVLLSSVNKCINIQ